MGVTLITLVFISGIFVIPAAADLTLIYFLRHAEIDKENPEKPLTAKGRERAAALVRHFEGIKITYIYASHTDRTRDTVLPLAKAQRLKGLSKILTPFIIISSHDYLLAEAALSHFCGLSIFQITADIYRGSKNIG